MTRKTSRGFVWVKVKELLNFWVAVCKPGTIIFEAEGVSSGKQLEKAMRLAAQKVTCNHQNLLLNQIITEN